VLGYLPAPEVPLLYAGAAALVYPSLQEGFGYPPLEAMAMGCPVITSNTSSLPEVAGQAALSVSPTNAAAVSGALETVLTDRALAERLVEAGLSQASNFRQERATEQTLDVYRRALGSRVAV
jgi:glycosyltransferase involved in cell wall biosynthesis